MVVPITPDEDAETAMVGGGVGSRHTATLDKFSKLAVYIHAFIQYTHNNNKRRVHNLRPSEGRNTGRLERKIGKGEVVLIIF